MQSVSLPLIFSFALLATPVWADEPATSPSPNPKAAFNKADSNQDQRLSLEEYLSSRMRAETAMFKQSDANGDGFLSRHEMPGLIKNKVKKLNKMREAAQKMQPTAE